MSEGRSRLLWPADGPATSAPAAVRDRPGPGLGRRGGTNLRSYLQWARLQGADNARVTETVLPETDDDSVRILTVHAAKGLEFPVVVLSGMTTKLDKPRPGPTVAFDSSGAPVVKLRAGSGVGELRDVETDRRADGRP